MHNIHTSKNEDRRPDSVEKEACDNINTMWTRLVSHNITQIPPKKKDSKRINQQFKEADVIEPNWLKDLI